MFILSFTIIIIPSITLMLIVIFILIPLLLFILIHIVILQVRRLRRLQLLGSSALEGAAARLGWGVCASGS